MKRGLTKYMGMKRVSLDIPTDVQDYVAAVVAEYRALHILSVAERYGNTEDHIEIAKMRGGKQAFGMIGVLPPEQQRAVAAWISYADEADETARKTTVEVDKARNLAIAKALWLKAEASMAVLINELSGGQHQHDKYTSDLIYTAIKLPQQSEG